MGKLNTHHIISHISSDGRRVSSEHFIFSGQPFSLSRGDKLRHRLGQNFKEDSSLAIPFRNFGLGHTHSRGIPQPSQSGCPMQSSGRDPYFLRSRNPSQGLGIVGGLGFDQQLDSGSLKLGYKLALKHAQEQDTR
jgi:hypothetical protein